MSSRAGDGNFGGSSKSTSARAKVLEAFSTLAPAGTFIDALNEFERAVREEVRNQYRESPYRGSRE